MEILKAFDTLDNLFEVQTTEEIIRSKNIYQRYQD